MKQFLGLIVFGLAIAMAIPASAQTTGLDGGDTSGTTGKRDKKNLNPTEAKTINVKDNGRYVQIVIGRDGSIEVKVTRKYDANKIAVLANKYPELAEALEDFPTKLGSSDVELSIGLTSRVKADSLLSLKEKSATGFELYKRYHDRDEIDNIDILADEDDIIGVVDQGTAGKKSYDARNKARRLPKANVGTVSSSKDKMDQEDDLGDLLKDDEQDQKNNKKNSRKRKQADDDDDN